MAAEAGTLKYLKASRLITVRNRTEVRAVGLEIQKPGPEQGSEYLVLEVRSAWVVGLKISSWAIQVVFLMCSPCWLRRSEQGPSLTGNLKKTKDLNLKNSEVEPLSKCLFLVTCFWCCLIHCCPPYYFFTLKSWPSVAMLLYSLIVSELVEMPHFLNWIYTCSSLQKWF